MSRRAMILLGIGTAALAAFLMIAWALPRATREQFPLRDARTVEGNRLDYQLPQRELGWFSSLLWRPPDHDIDGPVVWMSFGDAEWGGNRASNTELRESKGKVRLRASGVLCFSLPDQAQGEVVSVRLINPPQAWVGVAAGVLAFVAAAVIVRVSRPLGQWTLAGAVCVLLTTLSHPILTGVANGGDAAQNFQLASNLVDHGVLSMSAREPFEPSNYREPIPPLISALGITIGRALSPAWISVPAERSTDWLSAKMPNLAWMFLGLASAWCLCWTLSGSHVAALIATWLSWMSLYSRPYYLNSLLTDAPAAALITSVCLLLVVSVLRSSLLYVLAAGVVAGVLCLVKAALFPVLLLGAAVCSLGLVFVNAKRYVPTRRRALIGSLIFVASMVLTCLPWMVRNKLSLDSWSIAGRSSEVLALRAAKNQMTDDEWRAGWWLWGPRIYRDLVAGTPLAAKREDFAKGGQFARISRSLDTRDVSYFGQARDLRSSLEAQYKSKGHLSRKEIGEAVDRDQRQWAWQMIRGNLFAHFWCTPLFAWRGVWCISLDSPFLPALSRAAVEYCEGLLAVVLWLALIGAFVIGASRVTPILLCATAVPVLMLVAHAGATHNIPRYTAPAIPVMCVCLVVFAAWIARHVRLMRCVDCIRYGYGLSAQCLARKAQP